MYHRTASSLNGNMHKLTVTIVQIYRIVANMQSRQRINHRIKLVEEYNMCGQRICHADILFSLMIRPLPSTRTSTHTTHGRLLTALHSPGQVQN